MTMNVHFNMPSFRKRPSVFSEPPFQNFGLTLPRIRNITKPRELMTKNKLPLTKSTARRISVNENVFSRSPNGEAVCRNLFFNLPDIFLGQNSLVRRLRKQHAYPFSRINASIFYNENQQGGRDNTQTASKAIRTSFRYLLPKLGQAQFLSKKSICFPTNVVRQRESALNKRMNIDYLFECERACWSHQSMNVCHSDSVWSNLVLKPSLIITSINFLGFPYRLGNA